jgi:hypothetical protein
MHTNINNESRPGQKLPTAHRSAPTAACPQPTQYVELHARSAFSFLRGAATPEELIAVCSELKMPAMALLDNDGLYGAARFHLAARRQAARRLFSYSTSLVQGEPRVQDEAREDEEEGVRAVTHVLCCDCDDCLNGAPLKLRGAGRVTRTGQTAAEILEEQRAARRAERARKKLRDEQ